MTNMDLTKLKGRIIVIEASIGAGKTTLGTYLSTYLNNNGIPTVFYPEYVNTKLLQLYLSDIDKYAFMYQIHVLSEYNSVFMQAQEMAKQGKCCIIDRGYMGHYAFALLHKDAGRFSTREWETYMDILTDIRVKGSYTCIYLSVSPVVCMERIYRRNRPGEKGAYTLSYLDDLHRNHMYSFECSNTHVHHIDWNKHMDISDQHVLDICGVVLM